MFDNDKKNILNKADKSKKGRIDRDIKQLVKFINSLDDYYTNSSCSGRIVVQSALKKGESKWIFIKHSSVKFSEINKSLTILPKEPLWFKQEPIILHITCRTIDNAQKLLDLAREAGLKRSGIIGTRKKIVVEIIGTERIEAIIAKDGKLLINDDYIKELIIEANKKLKMAKKRISLFYIILRSNNK